MGRNQELKAIRKAARKLEQTNSKFVVDSIRATVKVMTFKERLKFAIKILLRRF